ncbi:transcriptional regulator [Glutamicibacter protophormiae]|uniref:DNA-binding MarR family transcriptional regulator n=1 Tax=Glutamicibacter protophormiae TaxID=37930 RepID=A0ABS4XP89_GLUPR|nr:transcriptional regulator [Glutamicibacter protophormiae]MBP2398321.1 DNA-binding MarR family transcriptional regulator [Glutamicibacter protophormiae]GGL89664.1 MarR family transcriptional regulator [Glutamicibacter protophormiae]
MSKPAEPRFDELIHAPLRLRICASLAPVQWAEFAHLKENLNVAVSVLSKHLKQLADAGYVEIERFAKLGRSHVRVSLTVKGRTAYVQHVAALRKITEGE